MNIESTDKIKPEIYDKTNEVSVFKAIFWLGIGWEHCVQQGAQTVSYVVSIEGPPVQSFPYYLLIQLLVKMKSYIASIVVIFGIDSTGPHIVLVIKR